MYKVVDRDRHNLPIKGGFKTPAQANNWCKKHLPIRYVHLWGHKPPVSFRYYIMME